MTATAGFVEPAALIRWACAHPTGSPAALQETLTVRPETGSSHFHDLPRPRPATRSVTGSHGVAALRSLVGSASGSNGWR
jgi:hypothetical protein